MFYSCGIGINHNGDINIAKKLIDLAAFAGATRLNFKNAQLTLFTQRKNWPSLVKAPLEQQMAI